MDQVLAAEEYGLERPSKIYPKCRLLPQLEEEALNPTLPAHDAANQPPHGRDKAAYQPEVQTAPRHQSKDNTKARGYMKDLRDVLENKAGQSRSIYGSQGRATRRDDDRHTGYNKPKSGQAEYNRPESFELCRDVGLHRGAAHPLCFTDE